MALELKPQYIKALGRRAKAYEHMEQFRDALEGGNILLNAQHP